MNTLAVVRSEWIKIRSLPASAGALIAILPVTLAVSLLLHVTADQGGTTDISGDPLLPAFYGITFGQLAAMVFGVVVLSSEFATGGWRVSLTAVPRRGLLYGSKIGLVGALALPAGLVSSLVGYVSSRMFGASGGPGPGEAGVARAIFGGGLYLALMAVFAAGLTALLRSGTATLGLLLPLVLIVPFVVGDVAGGRAVEFLPDRAGQVILHAHPPGSLGPWQGIAVTAAWAAVAVLAGWWSLRRRDA